MADIEYIRPEGRKKYLSISKHQANANNNYSKWINMNIERDLFDYADYGNFQKNDNGNLSWACRAGNLWSLNPDRSSVGQNKEQFGFFQKPANQNEEWHGFPIIPFSKSRYSISDNLLDRWVQFGVISEDDVPAILNKKRI